MNQEILDEIEMLEKKAGSKRVRKKLIRRYKDLKYYLQMLWQLHNLKFKDNVDQQYLDELNQAIHEIEQKIKNLAAK